MTELNEAAALAIADQLWKPGHLPTPQAVAKLLLAVTQSQRREPCRHVDARRIAGGDWCAHCGALRFDTDNKWRVPLEQR